MPCNAEAPHLQKISEAVKGRGGVVVGIAMGNDRESGVVRFRDRHRVTYAIVFDREDRFDSERTEVPSSVLVDRDGIVRWKEDGYDPEIFAALEKKYRALLAAGRPDRGRGEPGAAAPAE
jgi:peroxiredoxin